LRRRVALGAGVAVLIAGLVAGAAIWQVDRSADAKAAAARKFGPDGFGKLKLGMTKREALATGNLGVAPVAVVSGCQDYSFAAGPAPDPAAMAADAKAEKDYVDTTKKADELDAAVGPPPGSNASASEYADHATKLAASAQAKAALLQASADSVTRMAARTQALLASGGASFGAEKLRLIAAPPGARTAEGIGSGSTVEKLTAAYGPKGLKESDSRHELALPKHPGWKYAFDVEGGKVLAMLLINSDIPCS